MQTKEHTDEELRGYLREEKYPKLAQCSTWRWLPGLDKRTDARILSTRSRALGCDATEGLNSGCSRCGRDAKLLPMREGGCQLRPIYGSSVSVLLTAFGPLQLNAAPPRPTEHRSKHPPIWNSMPLPCDAVITCLGPSRPLTRTHVAPQ